MVKRMSCVYGKIKTSRLSVFLFSGSTTPTRTHTCVVSGSKRYSEIVWTKIFPRVEERISLNYETVPLRSTRALCVLESKTLLNPCNEKHVHTRFLRTVEAQSNATKLPQTVRVFEVIAHGDSYERNQI